MSKRAAKILVVTLVFLGLAVLIYTVVVGKTDGDQPVADLETELLLGHLPMLLHDNPEEVLAVVAGNSVVLDAIKQYDELESVNDAEYVLGVGKKYDVITAIQSGFTKKRFELYKKRLKSDGIMFQWVHIYTLSPEDVKTIVAMFQDVFSHTVLWQNFTGSEIFLVGKDTPLKIDFSALQKKMSREDIKVDLARSNLDNPFVLLSYSVLDSEGTQNFLQETEINTDNNLEALEKHRTNIFTILEGIDDLATQEMLGLYSLARTYVIQGEVYFTKELYREAEDAFLRAAALLGQSLPSVYKELGKTYIGQSNGEGAIWAYEQVRRLQPDDFRSRTELGILYGRKGLLNEAEQEFILILTYDENNYFAHNNLANVYRLKGTVSEAILEYQKSLEINPYQEEIIELLKSLR